MNFRTIFYVSCAALIGAGSPGSARGAEYQWDFDGLYPTFGGGVLTPLQPYALVTTGGSVPHIGGEPGWFLQVGVNTQPTYGYSAEFTATSANGGGAYVNQYTMIFDIYSPGPAGWQAIFNTDPNNPAGNDADFYIAPDGSIGIGALGYSDAGVISQNTWYRVAVSADLGAGFVSYYVNGNPVHTHIGASLLDGRFALYSNSHPGPDLRLFNEGDTSGNYTHLLALSSYYFTDRTMSFAEIAALGGPEASGIVQMQGDNNRDGTVDAADYVAWRKTDSPSGYSMWRTYFGESDGGSGASSIANSATGATAPEPAAAGLCCLALLAVLGAQRGRVMK